MLHVSWILLHVLGGVPFLPRMKPWCCIIFWHNDFCFVINSMLVASTFRHGVALPSLYLFGWKSRRLAMRVWYVCVCTCVTCAYLCACVLLIVHLLRWSEHMPLLVQSHDHDNHRDQWLLLADNCFLIDVSCLTLEVYSCLMIPSSKPSVELLGDHFLKAYCSCLAILFLITSPSL